MTDDMTCTCSNCGKDFQRKSRSGKKPGVCYECRETLGAARLKSLANVKAVPRLSGDERLAEEKREVARAFVEEDPTWLDDPAVQEQLVQRQQAAIEVIGETTPEQVGVVEHTSPACSAPTCSTPPTYPEAAARFCLNHWLKIDHTVRAVLLGAPVGSAPWNSACVKAIRSLR